MMTLKALNRVVTDTGIHNAGAIFKIDEKWGKFLIEKGAAENIRPNPENVIKNSPQKDKVINQATKERAKAEKSAKKFLKKTRKRTSYK